MGDSYDRVKEEQGRRDYQELVGLVYRYEVIAARLCCSKRKKKAWKYIYYYQEVKQDVTEVIEPWEGRIKGIKKELEKMQNKHYEWQQRNEAEFKLNEERHKKIEEWQTRLEKWMQQNTKQQTKLLEIINSH